MCIHSWYVIVYYIVLNQIYRFALCFQQVMFYVHCVVLQNMVDVLHESCECLTLFQMLGVVVVCFMLPEGK